MKFKIPESLKKASHHYCPGCGHGIIHRLMAEVIDDLGIREKIIAIAPVGCAVFGYFYWNFDTAEAAHGRPPAVATGIKRVLPDRIVITYQGDGDLAAIGGNEILHAANRGENITVLFVNNACYGMTGGQMAPTTLFNQTTTTTPKGRTLEDGYPIKVCEFISVFDGATYVERVSISNPPGIMKAKKSIKKALKNQMEGNGLSLVEFLSPCPTGWKISPVESLKWIEEKMTEYFPVKVFKDIE
ncbi:thiamine pyrophosphate-dependent enzyme [Elusimicrobiota bacterium]